MRQCGLHLSLRLPLCGVEVSNLMTEERTGVNDPDLMTLTQAAKFLRVRPTALMASVRTGEVPFYRRRGRLWFSRSELFARMERGDRSADRDHEDR